MEGKKVLITGVCGFIGSNLFLKLRDKNEIIGVDNFEYSSREVCKEILKEMTFIEGDVSDKKTFEKIPKDIDYIFHFGSPSSIILFKRNLYHCYQETVLGMLNVFEFGKENGIEKIIYPSSGSIYAGSPLPHKESIYPMPRNHYAAAKMACEAIAFCYQDFIKSIGLRIFAGYGPREEFKGDFASVVYLFIKDIIENKPVVIFGDGNQSRDFIFIDDVVNGIIKSAKVNYTGILNLGTGVSTSFNKLVKILTEILERDVKIKYVKKEKNYVDKLQADTKLMKKILKISVTPLEDGIRKFCEYLKIL